MPRAVLDIGSNSIKLLVYERDPAGRPQVLFSRARISRLSENLQRTGRLEHAAMERTLAAIQELLRAAGVAPTEVTAVVTAPGRKAANAADFLERLAQRTGLEASVLSGQREAELSLLATRRAFPDLDPLLMADIGGASTELVALIRDETRALTSIDVGVVRLTERFLPADPPQAEAVEQALGFAHERFGEVARGFAALWEGRVPQAVLVSGTATALARLHLQTPRPDDQVHGQELTQAHLAVLRARLMASTLAERKTWPSLDPARADVILAGVLLVEALFQSFGLERAWVSGQGVRWGLAWEALG
jgi:exopolyphosphatase/guanosine-5'-triphosphate,3'-diphosphate pyrophosphatase